ncbi:MATE family efflux transporter [Anaerocolumna sedimenticola]|uniref:MATE family efflux transporter n=2 Tax=Anaerocolumna sedimenticola TaxID=2696063 RepID=A0A6P1TQG6_9FIRM|nr:MATE family efflux transporter [Anaerocolumna sedimenticola]QHQ62141.1 MATE family efflux transporter [Anaerocolumna sedimenticola]
MYITNQMKIIAKDKPFLSKTIAITIPIALQGLLNTILNFVDILMIGKLGESTIAGVGLANKVFFVFTLLVFGIVSGSGVLTAQYWGKRDVVNIRKVLGISLILALSASILFVVPCIINPKFVMGIFTNSEETIRIGAVYLSIVVISYPFTAITNAYVSLLRGVNQVKAPVIISIASILVNVIFNYILIFGKFGFPELGVAGAAIATLMARVVESSVLLFIVYKNHGPAAAKLKELLSFNLEFIKKYFVTVSPVIANEFMWGLGVTLYSLAYGRMGDSAVAAITITQTVEQIMQVIFMSLSNAAAVILGNEMGAGHLKDAEKHAKNLIFIQLTLTVFVGIFCFFIRQPIINLFDVTDIVAGYVKLCFLVFILYMPFKMFNTINIVGILRSGGDTKACLFLDCTGVWFIGIPMAFIGGLVLHLPIYTVYAMVLIEEIYKFILGIKRYRKKKWLRNLVATEY